MSLINAKEDSAKTNMLMEEGDSSLEPGEVKTPPHGTESMKSRLAEDTNAKSSAPQFVIHAKSASKQATERCAEKVRAILELDAIKRKEELERKKEQKNESISHPNKIKKREQKKHNISNEELLDDYDFVDHTSEKSEEDVRKKHKHKKSKYEDRQTYSTHPIAESCESMRPIVSAVSLPLPSPMGFVTPLTNITTHFSRGFSGFNNSANYRAYNPFVRNYRTDFRHRGHPFNRPRFPRYRSQYNHGPYNAPIEETNNSTPLHSGVIPPSQLMWTKTKPSISFALNISERHKDSSNKERSDINVQKKNKNKKSKEREGSNKSQSSSKSNRKSSKRKKIRKIRETLQLKPFKSQLISPSHDIETTTIAKVEGPLNLNNTIETPKDSIKTEYSPKQAAEDECINPENSKSIKEHTNVEGKAANTSKPLILDMFARLTPPKEQSTPIGLKSSSNSSTNVQITKLQEIQDRIGKLLEDDDLKLETIQATKEKLLQKSREHAEVINLKKSLGKNKISVSTENNIHLNIFKMEEKQLDKGSKNNTKDICIMSKTLSDLKFKGKPFDIFDETNDDYMKRTKGDREYTPDSLHSEGFDLLSTNLVFNKNSSLRQKSNENSKVKRNISEKLKKSQEDSPCFHTKIVNCPNSGSPDTDDYSDNWENDDDEMELGVTFQNINKLEAPNYIKTERMSSSSPSSSIVDSAETDSNSKIESTTPKNSPPQRSMTPKFSYECKKSPNLVCRETNDMQLLYNQFIKSVENADVENEHDSCAAASNEDVKIEYENEQLSTSSASYSSTSSSSSDTSASSSGSSSTTSSSESASEDSNDTDTNQTNDLNTKCNDERANEKNSNSSTLEGEKPGTHATSTEESKQNVVKDLKRLENLEANLLRIQMMRANYDSADEISDELLKMEKLFLHEKNIILNKLIDSSAKKSIKVEKGNHSDLVTTAESLQSATRGQFVQSLQTLQNQEVEYKPEISNIFDTNREVIKLTISPVKLPKTSAIFEADNDTESSKQVTETAEKPNSTIKLPKPTKEVAIVKPIMESKGSPSTHHQKRRRSPISSHHTIQSRSRSRRGRVRSLSVSPSRNSNGRFMSPQRRSGFSKQSRNRNFDRRSRSRSPSFTRQLNRRSGDISPIPRKRRSLLGIEDRFRKHSPRRDSRSRSRSPSSPPSRHCDRYSRSPLPFKPPSPPTDPNLSPNDSRRNSLSPERRSRSTSRSPSKRNMSPSRKSYNSHRHRSLSPKHQHYKSHSPRQSNNTYYFNSSPNRISLDARINNHSEVTHSITTYEDYSHYGHYGPAAYMALPSDSNSFYPPNQYVQMANPGNSVPSGHVIHPNTYPNLRPIGTDEPEMYSSMPHQANLNAANFYYNRIGTQPFGFNQPSSVLKELPKATVAVQKGNVLEIVPCSDLLTGNIAEHTQGGNENQIKNEDKEKLVEETTDSNIDKSNRSILKPIDGDSNSLSKVAVSAPKKKKVNFEDGVFPNHNSDDEDRKVIEAKIRVKMRRLKKKLGITPQCHNLFENKDRKQKQKVNSNKKLPPPPPIGFAPASFEQPIYLRTHTPTPLLYFHFDGVVHSMYVSQMERPIPPRLLNPKCLTTSNVSIVSHQNDSQSPLYMQSPITAGAAHLHTCKKDAIATFTRPNRSENLSPKVVPTTTTALQQTGSPKINFKIYSPIENIHHTEAGSTTLPGTSPSSIKANAIHTISSVPIPNHLVQKRQDSPKDAVSTRANISIGLLPTPITHPPIPQSTSIPAQTRIPVIGVPPTVIPKMIPNVASESYMSGFTPTMLQPTHHQVNIMNQNYMIPPSIAHTNNPHMPVGGQPYFNAPVQRMHRPLPNYMGQPNQPTLSPSNMPMCHIAESIDTTNVDLDKFANPQTMPIPYNFKGP